MPKKLSERESPLLSPRCEERWPKDRFRAFRHHVETGEAGKRILETHLEECMPGKERAGDRAAEMSAVSAILRAYGFHPDVIEKKRKASEIWLARHGVIELAEIADSWERKTTCRLVAMFEAEIRRKGDGGGSQDRGI